MGAILDEARCMTGGFKVRRSFVSPARLHTRVGGGSQQVSSRQVKVNMIKQSDENGQNEEVRIYQQIIITNK